MPLIGNDDATDIPIWVPGTPTELTPLAAAFIMQANSTMTQIQRILSRMRSQVLYVDKFTPSKNWAVIDQRLRIVGEVWAYLELTLQRKNSVLKVPPSGNFAPVVVGAINDTSLVPKSLAALTSSKTGRLATGHVLNVGEVKLDAINSGADIQKDDIITLAGPYPLDDWIDSEV